MAAGDGVAPPRSPSKGDVLLLDDPATKWWAREDLHLQGSQILDLWGLLIPSEPLARNWCSRPESHRQPQPSEGCALIIELQEQQRMEPLAGAAPARFSYKENPQAAAERQKKWWAATVLPRVLRFKRPLHHSLMLAARKLSSV